MQTLEISGNPERTRQILEILSSVEPIFDKYPEYGSAIRFIRKRYERKGNLKDGRTFSVKLVFDNNREPFGKNECNFQNCYLEIEILPDSEGTSIFAYENLLQETSGIPATITIDPNCKIIFAALTGSKEARTFAKDPNFGEKITPEVIQVYGEHQSLILEALRTSQNQVLEALRRLTGQAVERQFSRNPIRPSFQLKE